MTKDNQLQRSRRRKKSHPVRNTFFALVAMLIIGLAGFSYYMFTHSSSPSTPIAAKNSNSKVINETIDSSGNGSASDQDTESSSSSSESSQSSSSSSSSQSSSSSSKTTGDSQALVGKSISEAIEWAKANGRYYSWRIESNDSNAKVVSVNDNGSSISFVAK